MNEKGMIGITWLIILLIFVVLALGILGISGMLSGYQNAQDEKSACEEKYNGTYGFGNLFGDSSCTIKEDGEYVSKKIVFIDDEWRLVR